MPVDYPDESLDPIMIPTSSTFHDLLNSTYGVSIHYFFILLIDAHYSSSEAGSSFLEAVVFSPNYAD